MSECGATDPARNAALGLTGFAGEDEGERALAGREIAPRPSRIKDGLQVLAPLLPAREEVAATALICERRIAGFR